MDIRVRWNLRTALERRLLNASLETGVSLARLRKRVVFERLLARLLVVSPDRWVLKGAFALDLRLRQTARSTLDLDLGRGDSVDVATAALLAAQRVDVGDYFQYAVADIAEMDLPMEGAAVRYHITAALAERRFESFIVDVGLSDPGMMPHESLRGYDTLSFADIPPLDVPVLIIEQHIAEKLHAYTRVYGGGRANTRVKDLVDLVLILSNLSVDAGKLRKALQITFGNRAIVEIPSSFPAPPEGWVIPYRRLADEVAIDGDIRSGFHRAASFLDPLLQTEINDELTWNPSRGMWLPRPEQQRHR